MVTVVVTITKTAPSRSSPRPRHRFFSEGSGIEKTRRPPTARKIGRSRAQSKIAEIKMQDLNATDLEGAINMIAGTARSMGLTVEG
jgi:large subunit ribosomal protein L11